MHFLSITPNPLHGRSDTPSTRTSSSLVAPPHPPDVTNSPKHDRCRPLVSIASYVSDNPRYAVSCLDSSRVALRRFIVTKQRFFRAPTSASVSLLKMLF